MLTPTAKIEKQDDGTLEVNVYWTDSNGPLDLPMTGGFALKAKDTKLAARLVKAIDAGVVYGPTVVMRDMNGATYVDAPYKIRGWTMNADLKHLGF
jgi:hypothetical protein